MGNQEDSYAIEFDRSVLPVLGKLTRSRPRRTSSKSRDVDFVVEVGDSVFVVEAKPSANPVTAKKAAENLKRVAKDQSAYPLLVVPYMTASTQSVCAAERISWADLSGNMHIEAGPFIAYVEGKPNRFPAVGRPGNVLTPARSRLLRVLLEKRKPMRMGELATEAQQSPAQVTREVTSLVHHGLLSRTVDRRVVVKDAESALDAWASEYQFRRHTLVEGHMPGSAEERMAKLGKVLAPYKIAFTGLSAAQAYTEFLTNYRLVSAFIERAPDSTVFEKLLFTPEPRGANTWLVVPNDAFVFYGANEIAGSRFVSRIQTYLDLQAHPERSKEVAGEVLRQLYEAWRA